MESRHNLFFINQAIELLRGINDEQFLNPSPVHNAGGIGPHIRHCIEHYQSVLNGLESKMIDYEARKRDKKIETNRLYAIQKLQELYHEWANIQMDIHDQLLVKFETRLESTQENYVASTFGRESMSVMSHTVHHFALIALLLNNMNIPVPKGFGVAPSTLKYEAKQAN